MNSDNKTHEEIFATIEKSKSIVAKERDKLRAIYSDIESFLDSLDQGIESIEHGKAEIEIGIDELSQYISNARINMNCKCTEEQKHGETTVKCCNECGLPVQEGWDFEQPVQQNI